MCKLDFYLDSSFHCFYFFYVVPPQVDHNHGVNNKTKKKKSKVKTCTKTQNKHTSKKSARKIKKKTM